MPSGGVSISIAALSATSRRVIILNTAGGAVADCRICVFFCRGATVKAGGARAGLFARPAAHGLGQRCLHLRTAEWRDLRLPSRRNGSGGSGASSADRLRADRVIPADVARCWWADSSILPPRLRPDPRDPTSSIPQRHRWRRGPGQTVIADPTVRQVQASPLRRRSGPHPAGSARHDPLGWARPDLLPGRARGRLGAGQAGHSRSWRPGPALHRKS